MFGVLVFLTLGWRQLSLTRNRRAAMARLARATERLAESDGHIAEKLEGIPDAATLRPETLPDRRLRFEAEQRGLLAQEEARRRLADALGQAEVELAADSVRSRMEIDPGATTEAHPEVQPVASPPGGASRTDPDAQPEALTAAATTLIGRVRSLASRARGALAAKDLELQQILAQPVTLPPNVPPEAEAVETALQERRNEQVETAEREEGLEQLLAEQGRAALNPLVLDEELQMTRAYWAQIALDVEIHRRANKLLADAYEEFRAADQQRLLGCISAQIGRLTGALLGPLETTGPLEDVLVRSTDRLLPLDSPPLSYGEFHACLLAIRLRGRLPRALGGATAVPGGRTLHPPRRGALDGRLGPCSKRLPGTVR